MRFLAACFAIALGSCITGDPRQLRLDLIPRGSCGGSTLNYDISCISALELKIVSLTGAEYGTACTPIGGRFGTLNDLVIPKEVMTLFQDAPTHQDVVLQLRAYGAFDREEACTDLLEGDLMLWGASDPIDLSNRVQQAITVQFECRPGCDCAAQDTDPTGCPPALVAGVCTPPELQKCRKSCSSNSSCYGGSLTCVDAACFAQPSTTCASCNGATDCASGICVQNTTTDETFCAQRCPPVQGSNPCTPRMSCKKTGGTIFKTLP